MITVKLEGDHRAILSRFSRAPDEVRSRLNRAMELIGEELLALMESKASGLKQKTGRLERSFYSKVKETDGGDRFVLTTGVNRRAFYAAFQDRGIRAREIEVKGYTRGAKSRNQKEGRRRTLSGVDFVSGYRRQIHLTAEPFIGVSLEEMRSVIVREIQLAVGGALG